MHGELINVAQAWDKLTTHEDFDSADASSMQDACHIWTHLNHLGLHEFS